MSQQALNGRPAQVMDSSSHQREQRRGGEEWRRKGALCEGCWNSFKMSSCASSHTCSCIYVLWVFVFFLFLFFYLRTFQRHNVALLSWLPRSKDVHTRLNGSSCASVCASGQSLRPLESPSFTPGRCTRLLTLYCCSFAATFTSFLLVSEEAIPLIKVSMRFFCFVRFLVQGSENLKKQKKSQKRWKQ